MGVGKISPDLFEAKAFIFDVDGVIVDSEPVHLISFQRYFKNFGITYTRKEHFSKFIGTGSRHIIGTKFKEYGVKVDLEKEVEKRARLYQRIIRKRRVLKPVAGVREFVHSAKRAGIKLAIASVGRRANVLAEIRAVGLSPKIFGVIVTEEDIKHRKPHPEIFLKVAKALRVKPKDCIVFEDSPAGVEAARRAKMKVVALLTTTPRRKLRGADWYVARKKA